MYFIILTLFTSQCNVLELEFCIQLLYQHGLDYNIAKTFDDCQQQIKCQTSRIIFQFAIIYFPTKFNFKIQMMHR